VPERKGMALILGKSFLVLVVQVESLPTTAVLMHALPGCILGCEELKKLGWKL